MYSTLYPYTVLMYCNALYTTRRDYELYSRRVEQADLVSIVTVRAGRESVELRERQAGGARE